MSATSGRIVHWRNRFQVPVPPFHRRASRGGRSGPRHWRGGSWHV